MLLRQSARTLFLVFCLFMGGNFGGLSAYAQQHWPQKPVRLIVPFPPGGVTDALGRITAEWLSQRLGESVVVENKPGASGAIAADFVARAAPDGYTILLAATPQLGIMPHLQKIPYDPISDFSPIGVVGALTFALGVNRERVPAESLKEFISYVKSRPGQLNFASPGSGTVSHLTMVLFMASAGIQMEAVLYKGGGPAIQDVVGGHVPVTFLSFSELIPHVASGRLRVLAVSADKRSAQFPDVPTILEQGYSGFRIPPHRNGLVAPANTPVAVIDTIAKETIAACLDAGFVARLNKIGVDPVCSTPAEFREAIRKDFELWKEAVKIGGIKPQ